MPCSISTNAPKSVTFVTLPVMRPPAGNNGRRVLLSLLETPADALGSGVEL
jgi:hypothetical protein